MARKLSKQIGAWYLQIVDKKLAALGMTGTREESISDVQACFALSPRPSDGY